MKIDEDFVFEYRLSSNDSERKRERELSHTTFQDCKTICRMSQKAD